MLISEAAVTTCSVNPNSSEAAKVSSSESPTLESTQHDVVVKTEGGEMSKEKEVIVLNDSLDECDFKQPKKRFRAPITIADEGPVSMSLHVQCIQCMYMYMRITCTNVNCTFTYLRVFIQNLCVHVHICMQCVLYI